MPKRASVNRIRIFHNMARSGGTLISKCLGCMQNAILLSEIHPLGSRWFNPLLQAQQWFQLFSAEELSAFEQLKAVSFVDLLSLIEEKCRLLNKIMIIRDWSHLDFTGTPFVKKPSYQLTTAEIFRDRFEIINYSSVRHPIDQWLSLRNLKLLHDTLTLEVFLEGYYRFAEKSVEIGFIRYEDFVKEPEHKMMQLCGNLSLPYDPNFINKWYDYKTITGDTQSARGDKRIIKPVPRKKMEPGLMERFEENPNYQRSLDLLGYGHPG
jgi:protein O-GlcNAc transferase